MAVTTRRREEPRAQQIGPGEFLRDVYDERRKVQKRIFPGYILVKMKMSNESWFVVRNTPGVTSFVGSANSPVPLQEKEVRAIQKQMLFFSSRRRHTIFDCDWSSDVCSSD